MVTATNSGAILANQASEEFRHASEVLGRVGLTQYEARAYIALVGRGLGDASAIAQSAGIPRTSAYKVLESLAEKGYAKATGGKPILFRPTPPLDVAENLKGAIQEVFEALAELHREVAEHGEPQLVYLLSGRDKVLAKITELLDQSTRSFILTTPRLAEIREELEKKVQHALKRGVAVTFVTAPLQRTPEGVQYVSRENLMATEVLADDQHALLAAPGLEACGYTDNPILTAHLQQFLEILLDREPERPSTP
ncbi:MAG: TrmB family transcriptional regulator [Thermoplasmatales archaeon]|jgi:sugar-specific transcriptional regulator TrmB|nr:TrmB family transcriptional regulator [Candidatus Thermoplasmatota archaeon]MCL5983536.1 TrmB family transcriptional regulator [Candidatus Thermoplasmatota archaeon]MCW6167286.1 TrmB family transcriptional regulator [Thermoplasmatales archaeon]